MMSVILASTAGAQVPPPAPPPLPSETKPSPLPSPSPTPIDPTAPLDLQQRYQNCFDKFVQSGSTDQKFMRSCLGLVPRETKNGKLEYFTRTELAEGDKKRTADVKTCYARVLELTKDLSIYPQGRLDVFLRVDGAGKMKQFRIGKQGLRDSQLLLCINQVKDSWTFPETTSKKLVPIRYRWVLEATKDRKPKVMLADGYPKVKKPPGLTPAEIVPAVKAGEHLVQGCYAQAIKVNPKAQGKIIVEMLVGKRGRVRQTKILLSEINDPALQQCMQTQLARLKFPPPRGGKPFPVRYPFLLTTLP